MGKQTRLIAFYLPQYHPIPENDVWWGKGFTEWTNVAKAKPLFPGHHQPKLPSELGFYDLRVPEVRNAQAELAREYGIEGFCYWHYWFSGKRLLERPFSEVLKKKEPDFPFCLAWANQSWTGIWHGAPNKVLIEQHYPGKNDYINHFSALIEAFADDRYLKIDGKPIFLVMHPNNLPNCIEFVDTWRELALRAGLKGIYFIGVHAESSGQFGLDGSLVHEMQPVFSKYKHSSRNRMFRLKDDLRTKQLLYLALDLLYPSTIRMYKDMIRSGTGLQLLFNEFPVAIPNWDNTPRVGSKGLIFHGSTPELFNRHLDNLIDLVQNRPLSTRLVFIKSWNEWAEGNYLEPDSCYGRGYLQAIRDSMD